MNENFTKKELEIAEKFQQRKRIIDNSMDVFCYKMREKMYHDMDIVLWKACTYAYLFKKLLKAVEKLSSALASNKKENIINESIDIASYAMMISDITENSKE